MSATTRRADSLLVEARVPEGYSASRDEHQWHRNPMGTSLPAPIDVTKASAGVVLEHADVLLAACPERNDYEYRVVFVTLETTTWVIA